VSDGPKKPKQYDLGTSLDYLRSIPSSTFMWKGEVQESKRKDNITPPPVRMRKRKRRKK
jgi:hypothetical protein